MPIMPEGWKQIVFKAPVWWKGAASRLQEQLQEKGERITLEEAMRRLYRLGAEVAGVWQEGPMPKG